MKRRHKEHSDLESASRKIKKLVMAKKENKEVEDKGEITPEMIERQLERVSELQDEKRELEKNKKKKKPDDVTRLETETKELKMRLKLVDKFHR